MDPNLGFPCTTDGEINGAFVTRPTYTQDPEPVDSRPRVARACETCRRRKRKVSRQESVADSANSHSAMEALRARHV
jgi:hypothetical protein